jgi:hypothetical protein
MPLIIEDGTGIANADSYVTVAECDAFAVAFFGASLGGSLADKEAALRRAAAFMNGLPWKGLRTEGRDQGLAWPRTGVTDGEENDISENEIPQEIKRAQMIFARAEFQTPGLLSPVVNIVQQKTLIEVRGIRWQPRSAPNTIEAARPVVTAAMEQVKDLLIAKTMFLDRA